MANVSTVGQTKTFSPWGTLDQGGNFPGDVALLRAYPWLGFRIGVIGNP
jgi:hypothetical protein